MSARNPIIDGAGTDVLIGQSGADEFVMQRDGLTDYIRSFDDMIDKANMKDFDVTWDSVMIRRVSLTEYKVTVRDEFFRVTFEPPETEDIPASGWLLDEDDFIFDTGLATPPQQVHFETTPGVVELLHGTSLPDVFVLQNDNIRDNVMDFEPGKDLIDLTDYNVAFGDLRLQTRKNGKVAVVIVDENEGRDALTIRDVSRDLTIDDIDADWFIF